MTTGERMRMFRKKKGWTQKTLGTASGINEVTIRKYESGRIEPKKENLNKIASALGVTAYELDPQYGISAMTLIAQQGIDALAALTLGASSNEGASFAAATMGKAINQSLVSTSQQALEVIPEREDILIHHYRELNPTGQKEAVKRVKELTQIDEYTKEEEEK